MQKPRYKFGVVFWLLALCVFVFPINNLLIRIGVILLALAAYGSLIYFFRNHKTIVFGLLFSGVLVGIFLLLPGSKPEPKKLRRAYLQALQSYKGTRYIWGGENKLGIDCSGLVRAGLIKANFEQGLLRANPWLVRYSLSLWWHDCSAKALSEEYRGLTRRIASTPSINSLDETQIQTGDIAVTADGIHVLAFLGKNEWIEADPNLGKVVIVKVPSKSNPWFSVPVQIMRWTELETK